LAQNTKDATKFYEAKVEELGTNLKDLESIVQGKSNNLRVVEDGKLHSGFNSRDFANIFVYCSIETKGPQCWKCCFYFYIVKESSKEMYCTVRKRLHSHRRLGKIEWGGYLNRRKEELEQSTQSGKYCRSQQISVESGSEKKIGSMW